MLISRNIDPFLVILDPTSRWHECLEHIIVVAIVGEVDRGRTASVEKGVGTAGDIGGRHAEARSSVALIGSVSANGPGDGRQMRLQQPPIPQLTVKGLDNHLGVLCDQFLVPIWVGTTRDHGNLYAIVQIILPVGEVDNNAKKDPAKTTGVAEADEGRVRGLNVFIVRIDSSRAERIAIGFVECAVGVFVEIRGQDRKAEAFGEGGVAPCYDIAGDEVFLGQDEVSKRLVHAAEDKEFSGFEEGYNIVEELVGEVEHASGRHRRRPFRFFLFASLLLSVRLFRVQWNGLCEVDKWLEFVGVGVIVENGSLDFCFGVGGRAGISIYRAGIAE